MLRQVSIQIKKMREKIAASIIKATNIGV